MHACTHAFIIIIIIIIIIIARASPRPRRVDAAIAGINTGANSQSFIVCIRREYARVPSDRGPIESHILI